MEDGHVSMSSSEAQGKPPHLSTKNSFSSTLLSKFRASEKKEKKERTYGLTPSVRKKRRLLSESTTKRHHRIGSAGSSVIFPRSEDASTKISIEKLEETARNRSETNPFMLFFFGTIAALKVMGFYLITLETIVTVAATVGLTLYWYFSYDGSSSWNGGGIDFILVSFAVTSPISAAIGMAFTRRDNALVAVANFRSFSYHLYLAHCLWDWPEDGGRAGVQGVDWLEHCDAVMAQIVGIGDELSRFLTLPTTSRGRHRMTRSGRKEASRTAEVAYKLHESMAAQRMTRLTLYSERLKKDGLPAGEVSRMRQYERFMSDAIEQLRMFKIYRTPQALRAFGRIFTMVLPPFYAPTYAQVAKDVNSLGVGIFFGIITALALTALFESLQVLEDPFTAFLALEGIDVKEEFEVLNYAQLVATRSLIFPDAPEYPAARRAALTSKSKRILLVGLPPVQPYHQTRHPYSHHPPSVASEGGSLDLNTPLVDIPATIDLEHVDEELGMHLEDDDATVRETAFAELDNNTVRSRRRSLSRGNLSPSP